MDTLKPKQLVQHVQLIADLQVRKWKWFSIYIPPLDCSAVPKSPFQMGYGGNVMVISHDGVTQLLMMGVDGFIKICVI
jgi:hypothetical protein